MSEINIGFLIGKKHIWLICILICTSFYNSDAQTRKELRWASKLEKHLNVDWYQFLKRNQRISSIKLDSARIIKDDKQIELFYNTRFSYLPFREGFINQLNKNVKESLRRRYRNYYLSFYAGGKNVETFVPNYFRSRISIDSLRLDKRDNSNKTLVSCINRQNFQQGLSGVNIALWGSHGKYFEMTKDRWKWQRPRLFGTVEDLLPTGFVLNYLSPMLENAGAYVLMPRERDTQSNEIIVDNDLSTEGSKFEVSADDQNIIGLQSGFKWIDTLFNYQNPFQLGTALIFDSIRLNEASVQYIPNITESGYYAVYVSYKSLPTSTDKAKYFVYHTGGVTEFDVNQTIGGGTWIYLGKFHFNKGLNSNSGKVVLTNGDTEKTLTADAVRFGGGMGNVARKSDKSDWQLSGVPRYMEGARYNLQYSGFPADKVYSLKNYEHDYKDDYLSRGEWINYLRGEVRYHSNEKLDGFNIPVDVVLAFHTDAGITPNDSVIGTLAIFSTDLDEGLFPYGQTKMASRDLADMVQTQLENDLSKEVKLDWTRRGLWDKQYSEAWRPTVPVVLLELLSHQNMADMKRALDPRFQFIASRAIYKALLKFQSYQTGRDYVIQPLPIDHFAIEKLECRKVRLSWNAVIDSLELTSKPSSYMLYKRTGDGGFDNGMLVKETSVELELEELNQVYSFKVCAVNEGGESMPSEILSVGLSDKNRGTVLVVNGFDRVCAPPTIDTPNFAGISWWDDEGVSKGHDVIRTGNQYDYNRNSKWLDDDSPGWGASYANEEGLLQVGNTFDYPAIHGEAILECGYSFVSISDEVFEERNEWNNYYAIDWIAGEEKTTSKLNSNLGFEFSVFTSQSMQQIGKYLSNGGNIFLSGAHVGTDLFMSPDSSAINFAKDVLHYRWVTNHASKNGEVIPINTNNIINKEFFFNTEISKRYYKVEAPDALLPDGKGSGELFRYGENLTTAGVFYKGNYGTIILGFPYETITSEEVRNKLMEGILNYFKK